MNNGAGRTGVNGTAQLDSKTIITSHAPKPSNLRRQVICARLINKETSRAGF
jgi:hypothetical protein